MKQYLLFCLLLFLSIKLSAQNLVLSKSKDSQKSELNFYYTDEVAMGHPHFDIKGTESFPIGKPVLLFEAEDHQNCYLVNPGDTLILTKLKGALTTTVVRTNKKYTKAQNDEFLFFSRLIRDIGAIRFPFICPPDFKKPQNQQQREQKIRAMYQARLNYLKNYTLKYPISVSFAEYCKSLFSGILIQDLLTLCRKSETVSSLSIKEYGNHFAELKRQLVSYSSAINHIEYQKALINLGYLLTNAIDPMDFPKVSSVISAEFTNGDREFLLAYRLIQLIKTGKISAVAAGQYVKDYQQSFPKSIYSNKLSEYYHNGLNAKKAAASSITTITMANGNKSTWLQLLAANKGKVVYVDFWASWCAPCKAEMPASVQLRKYYAGKPVSFVYLSLDEKPGDWKNSAASLKLPVAFSYLIEGDFKAKLARDLKITSIPRYLLIDKNGKIFSADAARPSEQKLKQAIAKLLEG